MSDDKVTELAKKLKELAERGVGGEKQNAEYHLQRLLEKHGMTLEDILEEKRDVREFKVPKEKEEFFFQVAASVVGREGVRHSKEGRSFLMNLTITEYLEIEAKFDFFWKAYKEELDIFYSAFVQKNKLYSKPSDKDKDNSEEKELTKEEKEKLRRMWAMADGIKRHTLTKQIDSK